MFKEEFTKEDLKIIKGCLLTTKETLKLVPFKNKDTKNKLIEIDNVLQKLAEGC